jgi:beta-lactam-binding protein with PASTA domain
MHILRELARSLACVLLLTGSASGEIFPRPAEPAASVAQGVRVPTLIGQRLEYAVALLGRHQLRLGSIDSVPSDSAAGMIIGQSPAAGNFVGPGQAIGVTIAIRRRPEFPVPVPSLLGLAPAEVMVSLREARLSLGPVDSSADPARAGRVIRQDPAPNDTVAVGSRVAVWYGYDAGVPVPEVLEMSVPDAGAALRAVGLSLGQVESLPTSRRAGLVIRQDPTEGTRVPPDTPVRIWYGYHRTIRVPDLRRRTSETAARMIEAAGLTLGVIDSAPTDGEPGTVIGQAPPAGTPVGPRGRVSITLGTIRPVIVPYVVGSTLAEATARLEGAGLRQGRLDRTEADGHTEMVLAQDPDPGVAVRRGSTVALRISAAKPVGARVDSEVPGAEPPMPIKFPIWLALLAALLTAAAAVPPTVRHIKDQRCRKRLELKDVPAAAGTHVLREQSESLIQPDLQLDPKAVPGTHVLIVDGPLFPEHLP